MSDPTITAPEVQAVIDHAQSAPLQSMAHASKISQLLQKFHAWFDHVEQKAQTAEADIKAKIEAEVAKVKTEYETLVTQLRAEVAELKAKIGTAV